MVMKIYYLMEIQKDIFKATYQKYTNFGLQRFRIDYEGTKI